MIRAFRAQASPGFVHQVLVQSRQVAEHLIVVLRGKVQKPF